MGSSDAEKTFINGDLINSPSNFQELMDAFIEESETNFVQVHIEDIIVFIREHVKNILRVSERLKEFNLRISREKTRLFR